MLSRSAPSDSRLGNLERGERGGMTIKGCWHANFFPHGKALRFAHWIGRYARLPCHISGFRVFEIPYLTSVANPDFDHCLFLSAPTRTSTNIETHMFNSHTHKRIDSCAGARSCACACQTTFCITSLSSIQVHRTPKCTRNIPALRRSSSPLLPFSTDILACTDIYHQVLTPAEPSMPLSRTRLTVLPSSNRKKRLPRSPARRLLHSYY